MTEVERQARKLARMEAGARRAALAELFGLSAVVLAELAAQGIDVDDEDTDWESVLAVLVALLIRGARQRVRAADGAARVFGEGAILAGAAAVQPLAAAKGVILPSIAAMPGAVTTMARSTQNPDKLTRWAASRSAESRTPRVAVRGATLRLARAVARTAGDTVHRAYHEGMAEVAKAVPGLDLIWRTEAGACPVCAPLEGSITGPDRQDVPPKHPSCRCWLEIDVSAMESNERILENGRAR